MNPEVNFYQTDESVAKSIAPLLLKIIGEKKRVFIFCQNKLQIQEIDSALWHYGRNKFIPHSTIFDNEFDPKRQPVFISDKEDNLNSADFLLFIDQPSEAFIKKFSRVFYFFEEGKNSATIKSANFYKKVNGKWEKSK